MKNDKSWTETNGYSIPCFQVVEKCIFLLPTGDQTEIISAPKTLPVLHNCMYLSILDNNTENYFSHFDGKLCVYFIYKTKNIIILYDFAKKVLIHKLLDFSLGDAPSINQLTY